MASSVFGDGTYNSAPFNALAYNEVGMELCNIRFVIQGAIKFLHGKADALEFDRTGAG